MTRALRYVCCRLPQHTNTRNLRSSASRYPLLVDPQGQAMAFLRNHMESRQTQLHVLTCDMDVPIVNADALSVGESQDDNLFAKSPEAAGNTGDSGQAPFVQPGPMPQLGTPRSAASDRSTTRPHGLLRQATAHARSVSAASEAGIGGEDFTPAQGVVGAVPRSPVRRMYKSSSADSLVSRTSPTHGARRDDDGDDGDDEDLAPRGLYRHTRRGSVDSLLGAAVGGTAILLSLPERQGTDASRAQAHVHRASSAAAQGWLDRRLKEVRGDATGSSMMSGDGDGMDAVSATSTLVPGAERQPLGFATVSWVTRLAQAVQEGEAVVVDRIGERIPPDLRGLLRGPRTVRGGRRFAFVDGALVPIHPSFRLFLATTHPDPHFPPEAQASVTLINFNLSTAALTEQLLASTVSHVQPALSRRHAGIRTRMAALRAQLQQHEDSLLQHLADAPGDILSDTTLVQTLETTRQAAAHTNEEVAATEATEARVGKAYERFRSVAAFLANLFQLVRRLSSLSPMYQLSLRS